MSFRRQTQLQAFVLEICNLIIGRFCSELNYNFMRLLAARPGFARVQCTKVFLYYIMHVIIINLPPESLYLLQKTESIFFR
jgi:hypothetical protein